MPRLKANERETRANSRRTAIRLVDLTLRFMETWRRRVGDYDSAMILLGVVAISAGRLLRSELDPELRDMTRPVPPTILGKCSVSSISVAIGLHRETTRRKVNQLIERGFLERDNSGSIRFPAGYLQTPGTAEIVSSQLDHFLRTANELLRDEVIELA